MGFHFIYSGRMEMSLNEVIDRYSILLLKKERLPENNALLKECVRFEKDILRHEDQKYIQEKIVLLKEVNGKIWDLESDIRKGKEGELGLEEVGRRALVIRDLNTERVRLKNLAAERLGEVKEVKVDHASSTS